MYKVILNSNIDSASVYREFSSYRRARDFANRLFHKRYTLAIREQGYPAEDFIVFNKSVFSEPEEIILHNRKETFNLSISRSDSTSTRSFNCNKPTVNGAKQAARITENNREFDAKLYSIQDRIDSIQVRQLLINNILESNPYCSVCGELFDSKNNITVKKVDNRIDYRRDNCILKHRDCYQNNSKSGIQFIYSE